MHTLSEKVSARIGELPNRDLAAPPDPRAQRRQAHRKPRGRTFIAVDESFDRVAREAERDSDLIAKRTAGLSAVAKGQSRSRPSELSLSYPFGSPTKVRVRSASPQCLPHSGGRSAKLWDVLRRSARTTRPISSPKYGPVRRSALVRRIACRLDMRKRLLSKDPGDNPKCTKIETAPIAASTVATRALRSDRGRWRTSPSG